MQRITRRRLPRLAGALVGALLTVTVFATIASAQREPTKTDGRALVQGLLLGSGEVARQLPEVFGELPEMPEPARKAEAVLLDAVGEQHPGFFDKFAERIHSGDHVAVQEALDEGSQVLHAVITKGGVLEQFDDFKLPYHYGWHPYRWHYLYRPFQWNYDYGYRFGYKWDPYVWHYRFLGPDPWFYRIDPESLLANERFVDLIVRHFAV